MQPVKASGWFNSGLSEQEMTTLKAAGIVPVNDIFYPVWGNKNKINLFFGGYGSGKSEFIQRYFVHLCRSDGYFRGYYGRKVLEDVRGSVHSKFITVIKDMGLQHEFHYSEENNGSMVIRHKKTGNKLVPFGAKTSDGLKSLDDPTHFFLEEMDQFTIEDFGTILTRLRTPKALVQLYGAFNTEKIFPGHWILETFLQDNNEDITDKQREIIEEVNKGGATKIFCNYTDNYFINQEDYYSTLVIAAAGDEGRLRSMAKGELGSYVPKNPFCKQFSADRHVSREAIFRQHLPIYFGFDFNIDPFAVNLAHIWRDQHGEHFHIFKEYSIAGGSVPELCDLLYLHYSTYLYNCFITGDAMGKKREIIKRDHSSAYLEIQRTLKLHQNQFKLPANPTHLNSRNDVNYLLYHHPDFKIHPDCKDTCRDMQIVECDAFGQIIKGDRKQISQQADHLDCVRYLINTFARQQWIIPHQRTHGYKQ